MKTRKPTAIKPCPFCGSNVKITKSAFTPPLSDNKAIHYYIVNHNEYTECPFIDFTIAANSLQTATREWNTRPAPGEKITKLCKYYVKSYNACFAAKGGERCKCEGNREKCEL